MNLGGRFREDLFKFILIFGLFSIQLTRLDARDDYDNFYIYRLFSNRGRMHDWAMKNFDKKTKRFPSYERMLQEFNQIIDGATSHDLSYGFSASFSSFVNSSNLRDGIGRTQKSALTLKILRYF